MAHVTRFIERRIPPRHAPRMRFSATPGRSRETAAASSAATRRRAEIPLDRLEARRAECPLQTATSRPASASRMRLAHLLTQRGLAASSSCCARRAAGVRVQRRPGPPAVPLGPGGRLRGGHVVRARARLEQQRAGSRAHVERPLRLRSVPASEQLARRRDAELYDPAPLRRRGAGLLRYRRTSGDGILCFEEAASRSLPESVR
jgi:hypothetical protein